MIDPDLASRSCALGAVFLTLVGFGFWQPAGYTPVLSEHYQQLRFTIRSLPDPAAVSSQQDLKESPAPKPAPAQPPEKSAPVKTQKTAPVPAPKPERMISRQTAPAQAKAEPKSQKRAVPKPEPAVNPQQKLTVNSTQQKSAAAEAAEKARAAAAAQAQLAEAREFISREIVSVIKSRTVYPRQALRRKVQGTVMLEFTVRKGIIQSCAVVKSSGSVLLDSAALRLGKSLQGFDSEQGDFDLKLQVPIRYALN